MKKCPNCQQIFSDDNQFCLNDGTVLYASEAGQSPPVFRTPDSVPTQFFSLPPPASAAKSPADSSRWLYLIIGVMATALIALGITFFVSRTLNEKETETSSVKENNNSKIDTEINTKTSPVPVPTVKQPPKNVAAPAPPVTPKFYSQSRIKFTKGAISSKVFGGIDAGGKRTYVLATRNGQYLSASVNSPNGCVVFNNQSPDISFSTGRGDQYLYLENKCGEANFSLTVFVR